MDTKIRKFSMVVLVVMFLAAGATQGSPALSQSLTASSTNGRIAFVSGGEIYVMNADGSGQTNLTNNTAWDSSPAWSPDGSKIAFVSSRDGNDEIYVVNADGSGVTRLTYNNERDFDWAPSWSPDGSKIAFTFCCLDDKKGIYVMNADGSGVTKLIQWGWGTFDFGPSWSPDGSKIAFPSCPGLGPGICVINIDGTGLTNLTTPTYDSYPSWSPCGSKIAFSSYQGVISRIYIMNANGSGVTQLTNNAAWDSDPSWSPDGNKVAFNSDRDGNWEIYVMNSDGSGQTNLTNNPAWDGEPSWGPGEVVSPTPTPGPTTQPTVQPTPTQTPQPTVTPGPTATTTPRPTSTPSAGDIHLNVQPLRQDSVDWGGDVYDLYPEGDTNPKHSLAFLGCATTSAAMVLNYYGAALGLQQTTPKELDDWLAGNGGYIAEKHWIFWPQVVAFVHDQMKGMTLTLVQPPKVQTTESRLDSALEKDIPPIVNVCYNTNAADCWNKDLMKWHWVVVTGKVGSDYTINDPSSWSGLNRQWLSQYPLWRLGTMVRYERGSSATFPSLWLYLCSPAEMLVTDSLGRRTGIDPTTGEEFSEIPGASYGDEYLSPADDSGGGTMHTKVLVLPEGGIYTVEVIGTGDGSYTLLAISSGDGGQPLSQSITRSVTPGQVDSYVLDYSPTDGDLELFQNTYLPLVLR